MKLFAKTDFPDLAQSGLEKFCLWLAESNSRFRAGSWLVAAFWIAAMAAYKTDIPVFIVVFAAGSMVNVVFCHVCHSLLQILKRVGGQKSAGMKSHFGGPVAHPSMSPSPSHDKVREFLEAFEEVFDSDWEYTKGMLGIYEVPEDQKQACANYGLEVTPYIADDGTFVNPKVDDEVEDWGNRAKLLKSYRALKKELA